MAKSETKTNTGFNPENVEIARTLVVPQLKMEQDAPIYFKVTGDMYIGDENPEKPQDKPADLCHVIDLTDGVEKSIVIPAVLKSVWDKDYEGGKQVGKCFMVTKGEKAKGKRYFNYKINEIKDPAA